MAMKLLSKSELDKAKANQQKRDIDEGLKLARRVDNLREVAAEEEASLKKFRSETVAKINAEISALTTTKETLAGEVSQLKRERKDLMKPLEEEWNRVYKEIAILDKHRNELASQKLTISDMEKAVREAMKQATNHLAAVARKEQRADDLLEGAFIRERETETRLKEAKDVEAKSLLKKNDVEKSLKDLANAMDSREHSLEVRERALKEGQEELKMGWVLLADRKAMVERRIKKKT